MLSDRLNRVLWGALVACGLRGLKSFGWLRGRLVRSQENLGNQDMQTRIYWDTVELDWKRVAPSGSDYTWWETDPWTGVTRTVEDSTVTYQWKKPPHLTLRIDIQNLESVEPYWWTPVEVAPSPPVIASDGSVTATWRLLPKSNEDHWDFLPKAPWRYGQ